MQVSWKYNYMDKSQRCVLREKDKIYREYSMK